MKAPTLLEINTRIRVLEKELEELYLARRGRILEQNAIPVGEDGWFCSGYCCVCGRNVVDVSAGFDTCEACIIAIGGPRAVRGRS